MPGELCVRVPGNSGRSRRLLRRSRGWGSLALVLVCVLPFGCSHSGEGRVPWPTVLPEEQGFDAKMLKDLVVRIDRGDYGSIHSLLIIRRDRLVLERYFRGYDREDLHPLFSVTKSVTAALVGIALDRGMIDSVRIRLGRYVPELDPQDPRGRITLEHILTMTGGFAWDELSAPYGDRRNPVMRLHESDDWTQFVLDLPLSDEPGKRFVYNSGSSMLLAEILRRATGQEGEQFARRSLFGPLGIEDLEWSSGPGGLTNTAWGLSLRPIDMGRFGVMMLHGGRWEGRQVVPEHWVRDACAARVPGPEPFWYGYQWWTMPLEMPGHAPSPSDIAIARGWGGQFIIMIPALDLVVVSTGGNYRDRDDQALVFLQDGILTALTDHFTEQPEAP